LQPLIVGAIVWLRHEEMSMNKLNNDYAREPFNRDIHSALLALGYFRVPFHCEDAGKYDLYCHDEGMIRISDEGHFVYAAGAHCFVHHPHTDWE
jgi:hypothetical protein